MPQNGHLNGSHARGQKRYFLDSEYQEWPRQTKPKKGQFMNFSQVLGCTLSGSPKPYNSRHLKPPEYSQISLLLNMAGDASFFKVVPERASQSWSWNSQQHCGYSPIT